MLFKKNRHDSICFRKITLAANKEDRLKKGDGKGKGRWEGWIKSRTAS